MDVTPVVSVVASLSIGSPRSSSAVFVSLGDIDLGSVVIGTSLTPVVLSRVFQHLQQLSRSRRLSSFVYKVLYVDVWILYVRLPVLIILQSMQRVAESAVSQFGLWEIVVDNALHNAIINPGSHYPHPDEQLAVLHHLVILTLFDPFVVWQI